MSKIKLLRFLKLFFIPLFLISLSINCTKNDEPYSYFQITPSDLILNANSQDWITFNLNGFATDGFTNLKIKQKKKNTSSQIILDSTINTVKNFNLAWEFLVPDSTTDYSLDLIFSLTDTKGEVFNIGRTLMARSFAHRMKFALRAYKLKDTYLTLPVTRIFSRASSQKGVVPSATTGGSFCGAQE